MNANKQTGRSHEDAPLPMGTIVYFRGTLRELESVSPGKISPSAVPAAGPPGERAAQAAESSPKAAKREDRRS